VTRIGHEGGEGNHGKTNREGAIASSGPDFKLASKGTSAEETGKRRQEPTESSSQNSKHSLKGKTRKKAGVFGMEIRYMICVKAGKDNRKRVDSPRVNEKVLADGGSQTLRELNLGKL